MVAGDRLKAMKSADSDICPLDDCRHTTEHLLWECSAYDFLRRPLLLDISKLIGAATAQGLAVSTYIQEVLGSTTFRCTGIVPANPAAADFAAKQANAVVLRPPLDPSMLIHPCRGAQFV